MGNTAKILYHSTDVEIKNSLNSILYFTLDFIQWTNQSEILF